MTNINTVTCGNKSKRGNQYVCNHRKKRCFGTRCTTYLDISSGTIVKIKTVMQSHKGNVRGRHRPASEPYKNGRYEPTRKEEGHLMKNV